MGESLTEKCRVEVEGPWVMNFFSRGRSNDSIWGINIGSDSSQEWLKSFRTSDLDEQACVASLFLKDAEEVVESIPNATAVQLDIMNHGSLYNYISQVDIVISLLPPSCHSIVAGACIQLKKHLVTASYDDDSTSKLDEMAKSSGVTILCETGLDPGIDHMMAMKMINHAHVRGGRIKSFISYSGGLPSPEAANNPLAYKFRGGRVDSAKRLRLADFPAFALECFGSIMRTLARIGFFSTEDMVLLHHEVEVDFPNGLPTENHRATLLECGKTKDGKTTTAMALTVWIPAAIGAMLWFRKKIQTKGILRPIDPEICVPELHESKIEEQDALVVETPIVEHSVKGQGPRL
ncbi:lysine-ketoglutarate reductase/saccharopine dehydrogenase bifunctional enzyme [Abeliophyllum distichum]|uniref:Lysine-ketoglutarate reductase/saccharopine dehydrogenase bifunctional enzyme n=1 Tax=Abeliophyllum distichum TaxID=126358 RepID=A0ABD1VD30_9LAMI